ncbi:Zinc finger protein ZFPM2 [Triplophysa tibetana]|uniref:Zinc finger protein ZFPM2 n=1 Tax=Triplophysa tibetana TaxID=1572043 RepID=A0A5A9N1D9_9TELE|nr:Zinc finger protein ZFPM2 [Triplophysa tibetana]
MAGKLAALHTYSSGHEETQSSPLDGGVEEEEEECIADGNELTTKDEYSMDENFAADFETDNLTCEDMEYFCGKGEENGSREMGDTEMEVESEKGRPPPLEPEEWDGPPGPDPRAEHRQVLLKKSGSQTTTSLRYMQIQTIRLWFSSKVSVQSCTGTVGSAEEASLAANLKGKQTSDGAGEITQTLSFLLR